MIYQVNEQRSDDIHKLETFNNMVLIGPNEGQVPDDNNDLSQMLDQFHLGDFLMENRHQLLPFLSKLIQSILFLLLYVYWFSSPLSLNSRASSKWTCTTILPQRVLNASLSSLLLIKLKVSLLKILRVRPIIFIVKVQLWLILEFCWVWILANCLIWLTLEGIDKAGNIRLNDFASLLQRVWIREWLNILDTEHHVVCEGLQKIWLVL